MRINIILLLNYGANINTELTGICFSYTLLPGTSVQMITEIKSLYDLMVIPNAAYHRRSIHRKYAKPIPSLQWPMSIY